LLELIRAWDQAGRSSPVTASRWYLIIAGSGPADYVAQLQQCITELGLAERVWLIGPQYGAEKEATFAAADAFILPSISEGMPNAVLEAWSWCLPTLITPQCNLPEGFAAGAALRIEPRAESISKGLDTLFGLSKERRRAMGRNGQDLVAAQFTWPSVAAQFDGVYRWLIGKGDRPSCVKMG
jgi:poly(glycerol-phosphate) alpha-glucosyltransferase